MRLKKMFVFLVALFVIFLAACTDTNGVDLEAYNFNILYADGDSINHVTKDITLPKGDESISLVWTSNNEAVIDKNGKVIRPEENDVNVTLTVTISFGTQSISKSFVLTVKKASETEDLTIDEILQSINILFSGTDTMDSVTQNINLPSGTLNYSVTWTSSDTNVIANDGKVSRPLEENKIVTLTVTVKINDEEKTKSFVLTVKKIEETEDLTIDEILESINLVFSGTDSVLGVTQNINLPKGNEKYTITWRSSNEKVITNDGKVIRPLENDERVTLIATVRFNDEEKDKVFEIVVLKQGESSVNTDIPETAKKLTTDEIIILLKTIAFNINDYKDLELKLSGDAAFDLVSSASLNNEMKYEDVLNYAIHLGKLDILAKLLEDDFIGRADVLANFSINKSQNIYYQGNLEQNDQRNLMINIGMQNYFTSDVIYLNHQGSYLSSFNDIQLNLEGKITHGQSLYSEIIILLSNIEALTQELNMAEIPSDQLKELIDMINGLNIYKDADRYFIDFSLNDNDLKEELIYSIYLSALFFSTGDNIEENLRAAIKEGLKKADLRLLVVFNENKLEKIKINLDIDSQTKFKDEYFTESAFNVDNEVLMDLKQYQMNMNLLADLTLEVNIVDNIRIELPESMLSYEEVDLLGAYEQVLHDLINVTDPSYEYSTYFIFDLNGVKYTTYNNSYYEADLYALADLFINPEHYEIEKLYYDEAMTQEIPKGTKISEFTYLDHVYAKLIEKEGTLNVKFIYDNGEEKTFTNAHVGQIFDNQHKDVYGLFDENLYKMFTYSDVELKNELKDGMIFESGTYYVVLKVKDVYQITFNNDFYMDIPAYYLVSGQMINTSNIEAYVFNFLESKGINQDSYQIEFLVNGLPLYYYDYEPMTGNLEVNVFISEIQKIQVELNIIFGNSRTTLSNFEIKSNSSYYQILSAFYQEYDVYLQAEIYQVTINGYEASYDYQLNFNDVLDIYMREYNEEEYSIYLINPEYAFMSEIYNVNRRYEDNALNILQSYEDNIKNSYFENIIVEYYLDENLTEMANVETINSTTILFVKITHEEFVKITFDFTDFQELGIDNFSILGIKNQTYYFYQLLEIINRKSNKYIDENSVIFYHNRVEITELTLTDENTIIFIEMVPLNTFKLEITVLLNGKIMDQGTYYLSQGTSIDSFIALHRDKDIYSGHLQDVSMIEGDNIDFISSDTVIIIELVPKTIKTITIHANDLETYSFSLFEGNEEQIFMNIHAYLVNLEQKSVDFKVYVDAQKTILLYDSLAGLDMQLFEQYKGELSNLYVDFESYVFFNVFYILIYNNAYYTAERSYKYENDDDLVLKVDEVYQDILMILEVDSLNLEYFKINGEPFETDYYPQNGEYILIEIMTV